MGCGLKTLADVSKGAILIKQKTELGFISGGGLYDTSISYNDDGDKIVDPNEDKQLDELDRKI